MKSTGYEFTGFRITPEGVSLERSDETQQGMLLQSIADACAPSVAVLDEFGNFLHVNKTWQHSADQHGLKVERYGVGINYLESCMAASGIPAKEAAAVAESVRAILEGNKTESHAEYSCLGSSSAPRYFLVRAARFNLPGVGGLFRVLVTHEDITSGRRAEEALRDIGGRLISAQEEERSRIARELHDDLSQRLALLSIEMDQLSQKIPARQSNLRARIHDIRAEMKEICMEVHRLSYQLHPSKLEHLGLAAATKSFCEELAARQGIKVEFRNDDIPVILPKDVALCVFRIVQESLRNVVKHSGSPDAVVLLSICDQTLHLCVSDSGAGFDVESPMLQKGLGLMSMRERLHIVGGELIIHSRPSRGTLIDVRVPLAKADDGGELAGIQVNPP